MFSVIDHFEYHLMNQTDIIYGHPWVYSFTKGTRPCDQAIENGRSKGHKTFICWQRNNNRYYSSFGTVDDFIEYYYSERIDPYERTFYWVLDDDPKTSRCLYLDIEWTSTGIDVDASDRITCVVEKCIGLLGDDAAHTFVVDSCRRVDAVTWKYSYHVYFPRIVFSNIPDMKTFIHTRLVRRLMGEKLAYYEPIRNKRKLIVDTCVYAYNRCFRVPGSRKLSMGSQQLIDRRILRHICLSGGTLMPTYSSDYTCSDTKFDNEDEMCDDAYVRDTGVHVEVATVDANVSHITSILRAHGDEHTIVGFNGKHYVGYTHRQHGRICMIDGTHHTGNNCFFVIHGDHIYMHCFGTGHSPGDGILIGTTCNDDTVLFSDDGEFISQVNSNSLWPEEKHVLINEYDSEYVNPFCLEFGRRVLLCVAGMGKGKSVRAVDYVSGIPMDKTILVVLNRRTLTWQTLQLFSSYGFSHYSSCDWGARRQIICYESLCKLSGMVFDYVIIDEIRSVCDSMTQCATNGGNIHYNHEMIRSYCRNARQTIILGADAEIDPVVSDVVCDWFPTPGSIQVERYTHAKIKRDLVIGVDENEWINRIRDAIAAGKKVAIPCRTKRRAHMLTGMLSPLLTCADDCLTITSDSSDDVIKDIMTDINPVLEHKQLFIFTSKVNVGVDVTLKWDTCFVDAIGSGCKARDILQMCGRLRNLIDKSIMVLTSTTTMTHNTWEDLKEQATNFINSRRDVLSTQYKGALTYDAEFDDGFIKMSPKSITRLFINVRAESYVDFNYDLARLAKLKQWRVFVPDRISERVPDDSVKTAGKVSAELQLDMRICAYNTVQAGNLFTLMIEKDKLIRSQHSTQEDRLIYETAHVLQYWGPDDIQTFEEFDFAAKNVHKIRNYVKLTTMNTMQIVRMELNRVQKHQWADLTARMDIVHYINIDKCLSLIGVDSILDRDTVIPSSVIFDHSNDIIALCMQSAVSSFRRVRQTKPTAIGLLRTELREVFGVKLQGLRVGRTSKINAYKLTTLPLFERLVASVNFGYDFGTEIPEFHDSRIDKRKRIKL